MKIDVAVVSLVDYAERAGLIEKEDKIFSVNRILEALNLDGIEECEPLENAELEDILKSILDYACENGLCENSVVYRDLFDTKLMSAVTPRPSEVISNFYELYDELSPEAATDYYYKLSRDTDYIRRYRIVKDMKWKTQTPYGELDITVNLSKPEKTPEEIAAAKKAIIVKTARAAKKAQKVKTAKTVKEAKTAKKVQTEKTAKTAKI